MQVDIIEVNLKQMICSKLVFSYSIFALKYIQNFKMTWMIKVEFFWFLKDFFIFVSERQSYTERAIEKPVLSPAPPHPTKWPQQPDLG